MTRSLSIFVLLGLVATAGLAGCTANSGPANPDDGKYVINGTYVPTIVTDPGSLDPQMAATPGAFELSGLAYDSIVGVDAGGNIVPQLAKSWEVKEYEASFEINDGITCSDGSEMTAETIVHNINWISTSSNSSPYLGTFVPEGISAVADPNTNTVYVDLSQPSPFLLTLLANVPMVCEAGLADRAHLASHTLGSGPYVLAEAVPMDHYTYERRDGYTWGPGGARTDSPGQPKIINVKIVSAEATALNMLINGDVNMATGFTVDTTRADEAGLNSIEIPSNLGNTWYNQNEGRPTQELAVRLALTQAVDLDELAKVITGGKGSGAKAMSVNPPAACSYDSVTGNIPAYDPAASVATLEEAGYVRGDDGFSRNGEPLAIEFAYDSTMGSAADAAAELAVKQWREVGFTVTANAKTTSEVSELVFSDGNWDVVWEPINLDSPDQMISFFSGATAEDNGANFSAIINQEYDDYITAGMSKTGEAACADFELAEASLFKNVNYLLWAQQTNKIYLNKAEYVYVGRTQATSLRLLAE